MSQQDIQPNISTNKNFNSRTFYESSYNGGSSLLVTIGSSKNDNSIYELFATNFEVIEPTIVEFIYK